jgi:hypothetical protein
MTGYGTLNNDLRWLRIFSKIKLYFIDRVCWSNKVSCISLVLWSSSSLAISKFWILAWKSLHCSSFAYFYKCVSNKLKHANATRTTNANIDPNTQHFCIVKRTALTCEWTRSKTHEYTNRTTNQHTVFNLQTILNDIQSKHSEPHKSSWTSRVAVCSTC